MLFRWSLSLVLICLLAEAGHACSLARYATQRSPTGVFFLATATADTLHAGPGTITFYPGDGRIQAPLEVPPRPIYGQVVRLEQIGGYLADSLRQIAAKVGDEVVVVPWGYRADCRTIAWTRSARWMPAGTRGVYTATLRPREHWADGRPTFDVGGWHDPYPHAAFLHLEEVPPDSRLTPEQFFSLQAALPRADVMERDPDQALRPLRDWLRKHPDLTGLQPAAEIIEDAGVSAMFARAAKVTPPVVGTYRIVVAVEGEAPRELFFRTTSRPTPAFGSGGREDSRDPDARLFRHPDAYGLQVLAAETEAGIPGNNREAWEQLCRPSGLTVSAEPQREAGAEMWTASLDWGMFRRCFPGSAGAARAVEMVTEQWRRREAERLPGRFRRDPDGTMHFEQTLRAEGRIILRVSGQRISVDTVERP